MNDHFLSEQAKRYVNKWISVTDTLIFNDAAQKEAILNWTGIRPNYYMIEGQESQACDLLIILGDEMAKLNHSIHGVKLQHYRHIFLDFIKSLNKMRQAGEHGKVIRILPRKRCSTFSSDLIELDEPSTSSSPEAGTCSIY